MNPRFILEQSYELPTKKKDAFMAYELVEGLTKVIIVLLGT